MAWLIRYNVGWVGLGLCCLLGSVAACTDDDAGDDSGGSGSGSESDSDSNGSSSDSASTDTGTSESSDSDSNSGGTASTSSGSSSASGGSTGSGGDTNGQPVTCGEMECGPGTYCIEPCCGGPAPNCEAVEATTCPDGTHQVDTCYGEPCGEGMLCCQTDPCVPDPAYCGPVEETVCEESPNSPQVRCSSPCFGNLDAGTIACECA